MNLDKTLSKNYRRGNPAEEHISDLALAWQFKCYTFGSEYERFQCGNDGSTWYMDGLFIFSLVNNLLFPMRQERDRRNEAK